MSKYQYIFIDTSTSTAYDNTLNLHEVTAYSHNIKINPTNAKLSTTMMPTIFNANNCIDNKTNSMCHSGGKIEEPKGSLLRLTYPSIQKIDKVIVHNRPYYSDRIVNSTLYVVESTTNNNL